MPDCGTTVTYGTVTIKNVLTTSIDYSPVMDQNGVDPIGVRTSVSFIGILHTSGSPGEPLYGNKVNFSQPPSQGLAVGINNLIQKWLQPRYRFTMTIGGGIIFDVIPGDVEACSQTVQANQAYSYQEINHGPRTSARVLSIQGTHAAKCQFNIEFVTPLQCAGELRDWLNLRYWIADDINCDTWTTRRTYEGVFRIRNRNVNPHVLARSITLPPLQKGFRRESIAWRESPDGLNFSFQIIDQQLYAQAPFPATRMDGSYSVAFDPGGINVRQELNFSLKGPPDVPKKALFTLAARIIDAKMNYNVMRLTNGGKDGSYFVQSMLWQEDLSNNAINVNIAARMLGVNKVLKGVPQITQGLNLGDFIGASVSQFAVGDYAGRDYDPEEAFLPKLPDTLGGVFACALQNPCCPQRLSEHRDPVTPETTQEYDPEINYYDLSGNLPEGDDDHYSPEHNEYMYQWYRVSNRYDIDTGWRGFPRGAQCNRTTPSMAFAQIHCPTGIREIYLESCRVDKWPEVPRPVHAWTDSRGIKYVLRNWRPEAPQCQLGADGRNTLREIAATYFYYMDQIPDVSSSGSLGVGIVPYANPDHFNQVGNWAVAEANKIQGNFFRNPASVFD